MGTPQEIRESSRLCCVRVPELSVQAHLRNRPELRGQKVAVMGPRPRDGIRNLSREAMEAGLKAGMSSVQALAVCPRAQILPWNEVEVSAAGTEIERALQTVSPQVEVEGDGVFFVGCRGLDLLHGGEDGILEKIREVLSAGGWSAFLGAAATRFVAFAAAFQELAVPSGKEVEFLASLPLSILPMSAALADRLHALGLRTLGALAALPLSSVELRYGKEGLLCHRLARGDDATVPRYAVLDQVLERRLEISAASIAEMESPMVETLQALLDQVRSRNRSCAALRVTFFLADGDCRDLEVALSRPSVQAKVFWNQLRLALSERSFPAPAEEVKVEVLREQCGAGEQGSLFQRAFEISASPPGRRLAEAIDRLRSFYGGSAVGRPSLQEGLRPEEKGTRLEPASSMKVASAPVPAPLGNRVLRPVLRILNPPVEVAAQGEAGRLRSFAWRGGRHRVRTMVGPERLAGEWWKEPFVRDYFQVLTEDRGLFWLYFDCQRRGWYLQGLFD